MRKPTESKYEWMRVVVLIGFAAFVVMGVVTGLLMVVWWVTDADWAIRAVRVTGWIGLGGCLVAWIVGLLWAAAEDEEAKRQAQDS